MRRGPRNRGVVAWHVLVGLSGLTIGTEPQPAEAQSPFWSKSRTGSRVDTLHYVVSVKGHGHLYVRRPTWRRKAPAPFGTLVRRGDLLYLDQTAQAKLVCGNMQVHEVPRGWSGVPSCMFSKLIIRDEEGDVPMLRGAPGIDPIIISPRATFLLSTRPRLRWLPVKSGEATYTVTLRDGEAEQSVEAGSTTQIEYPPSLASLKPGKVYRWRVTETGHHPTADWAGFRLIDPAEAKSVHGLEGKVNASKLTDVGKRFLIADLYASKRLYSEAIDQLEHLPREAREPSVLRLLGDCYRKTGLLFLAVKSYQGALEISKAMNDIEGKAITLDTLARIYVQQDREKEAIKCYEGAIAIYEERLGDNRKVFQIRRCLRMLKHR
jgi:hypothetical protein